LYNNSLTVDGSKITKELGFSYEVPVMTKANLMEIIKSFIEVKIFPAGIVN